MLELLCGVVLLALGVAGVSSLRGSGRRVGGVLLAMAALVWAGYRYWFISDTSWFIIRPLAGGWITLLTIILVVVVVVEFVLKRSSALIGWLAVIIALLAPFGDMLSGEVWWWARIWWVVAIFAAASAGLGVLFWSSKRFFAYCAWALAFVLAATLLAPYVPTDWTNTQVKIPAGSGTSQSAGSSDTGSPDPAFDAPAETITEAADPNYKKLAERLASQLEAQGVQLGEYTTDVSWSDHEVQNTLGFVDQPLKDHHDIVALLQGDSEASVAARTLVQQAMEEKYPSDPVRANTEMERALSGECYIPVQFTKDMQYEGQPYYEDEVVMTPDGYRAAVPGDVLWLCMSQDGEVIWRASMRADCGNVGFTDIRPVRPDTPAVPPVTVPHGPKDSCPEVPGYQGPDSQCLQPKSPAPQPSGAGDANQGTTGAVRPSPTPKPTPLEPSSPPSGGAGSSGGGSDGHSESASPQAPSQTASASGP